MRRACKGPLMSEENRIGRSFSDEKHASGEWRTRIIFSANPVVRLLLRYCSFKRSGIDTLAKKVAAAYPKRPRLVVDLGSGQGAYAHWFLGATVGKSSPGAAPLLLRLTGRTKRSSAYRRRRRTAEK